jgi:hypothetical protein
MSQQLSLVDYPCSTDGRLYEPEKDVILSAFVNDDLINLFSAADVLEEFKLYEDSSLQSCTEVTRIKDDRIGVALECLASKLIRFLESERVEGLKKIQSEIEVSDLMGELQIISCAYNLIKLKRDNFANVVTAVVVLG